jgi:hypothetical protein
METGGYAICGCVVTVFITATLGLVKVFRKKKCWWLINRPELFKNKSGIFN